MFVSVKPERIVNAPADPHHLTKGSTNVHALSENRERIYLLLLDRSMKNS
jgi:hypothetical protein